MAKSVYRYQFPEGIDLADAEASLVLSLFAIEHIHGESAARLDVGHSWDAVGRRCVIDASRRIGLELNRLFVGFLTRELGRDAFYVERVTCPAKRRSQRGGQRD